MKTKVILFAGSILLFYTIFNFGVRKLMKWDLENDKLHRKKKNRSRKKNQKHKKKHSYVPMPEWQKLNRKHALGELSVDYICVLILCLGMIVYALIYIP